MLNSTHGRIKNVYWSATGLCDLDIMGDVLAGANAIKNTVLIETWKRFRIMHA
jgi:hypothetical protein